MISDARTAPPKTLFIACGALAKETKELIDKHGFAAADIEEIRVAARWGVLDGVTTNPTLYGKIGGSYEDILRGRKRDGLVDYLITRWPTPFSNG